MLMVFHFILTCLIDSEEKAKLSREVVGDIERKDAELEWVVEQTKFFLKLFEQTN